MNRSLAQKLLGLLFGAVLVSLPVKAGAAPVLHGPQEVLERDCVWEGGTLYFAPPTGGRWELVSTTSDPAILNPGDGEFHPMSAEVVAAALAGLDYRLTDLDFHVYVLPYPRRSELRSAAADGVIYLAPGTSPYADAAVHGIVAHEVGHLVHRAYLRDDDRAGWEAYASLRGISGDARYSETAPHAYRPHEVFAEDFRALFGSPEARESGSLENTELIWPTEVTGLESFLRGLPERVASTAHLLAWPNPFRTHVRFAVNLPVAAQATRFTVASAGGGEPAPSSSAADAWSLAIYDVRGRLVRSESVSLESGAQAALGWDGKDSAGRPVSQGTYFLRLVPPRGMESESLEALKLVLAK